jgi:hypothetical protein
MGNIKTKDIGNFQQNVGKASSDINVFSSIIFGGILIVIGIVLAIFAFIPYNDDINKSCGGSDSDNTCFSSGGYCDAKTKKCIVKRKRYYLIIPAVFLILFSLLIMYGSRLWQKEVYSNKDMAELGGTIEEVDLVKNLFNN